MKQRWWLPLMILLLGIAAVWPMRNALTAEAIADRSPRQAGAAILFLLLLYGLKSLSVAFPLSALEAAGGLLFPFPLALIVNLCGVLLAHSLPFLLGRREQDDLTSLTHRHPRLARLKPDPKQPGQTGSWFSTRARWRLTAHRKRYFLRWTCSITSALRPRTRWNCAGS